MAEVSPFNFSQPSSEVDTPILPHTDKHTELGVRDLKLSRNFETGYCFRVADLMVVGNPTAEIFLLFETQLRQPPI